MKHKTWEFKRPRATKQRKKKKFGFWIPSESFKKRPRRIKGQMLVLLYNEEEFFFLKDLTITLVQIWQQATCRQINSPRATFLRGHYKSLFSKDLVCPNKIYYARAFSLERRHVINLANSFSRRDQTFEKRRTFQSTLKSEFIFLLRIKRIIQFIFKTFEFYSSSS